MALAHHLALVVPIVTVEIGRNGSHLHRCTRMHMHDDDMILRLSHVEMPVESPIRCLNPRGAELCFGSSACSTLGEEKCIFLLV